MIKIRAANEKDIESIYSFDHIAINQEKRRIFIVKSIKSGICFVAEIDRKIVGYIVLDYTFYSNGMISMLYIHPEYRRQGIGKQLIEFIESICKTEKLFTSTNQSNIQMQNLLNTSGYVRSGFIENLDKDDPEIIYFKKIE